MIVTHLIFSFTIGGAESMLVDIVNQQTKYAQINLVIINNEIDQSLLSKLDSRVMVHRIGRRKGSKSPLSVVRLNGLLARLKSNVIHCHNHNVILYTAPFLRRRMCLTVHDIRVESTHFHKYKRIYAISDCVKNYIYNETNIISERIYNGIDVHAISTKSNFVLPSKYRLVQISRLEHLKKGQDILIDAIAILREEGITNINLDFIGVGSSEEYLKEKVKNSALTDQIKFLGLKDRNYIYAHLRDYDILVQPSLFEGFGLTVVEGMIAKIPVLVSNIDGPMEVINQGEYGTFFESGSAISLAEKLKEILVLNIEKQYEYREGAYHFALNHFNIEVTAKEYIDSYTKYIEILKFKE